MSLTTTPETWLIYGLVDPRTAQIKYVGATAGDLGRRLTFHISSALAGKGTGGKVEWIKELVELELEPMIIELWRGPASEWQEQEQFFIKLFSRYKLFNVVAGGLGQWGAVKSPEERQRIGASVKAAIMAKREKNKAIKDPG